MITKVQQLGKTHPARSDKSPEFVGDIKTMIDSDLSKSIRAISKDTEVSEFLIRQKTFGIFNARCAKPTGLCTMPHKQKNPCMTVKTISATTSPATYGH